MTGFFGLHEVFFRDVLLADSIPISLCDPIYLQNSHEVDHSPIMLPKCFLVFFHVFHRCFLTFVHIFSHFCPHLFPSFSRVSLIFSYVCPSFCQGFPTFFSIILPLFSHYFPTVFPRFCPGFSLEINGCCRGKGLWEFEVQRIKVTEGFLVVRWGQVSRRFSAVVAGVSRSKAMKHF